MTLPIPLVQWPSTMKDHWASHSSRRLDFRLSRADMIERKFMKPRSRYRLITDDVRVLRLNREGKGLSVNKAAPLIGTNKSTLTALKNGQINLSERWIEKILRGYRTERKTFESIKEQRLSS